MFMLRSRNFLLVLAMLANGSMRNESYKYNIDSELLISILINLYPYAYYLRSCFIPT
jgi:hypothetical protein